MVREDLKDTYEKLKRRHKLYSKATTPSNILFLLGFLIMFPGVLILVVIYVDIPHPLIGFGLGMILMYIGGKVNKRTEKPPILYKTEQEFLNIFDVIKDLENYFSEKIDFHKTEAAKKISKFEKKLYRQAEERRTLWDELSKDMNREILLFKQNLRDKLLPTINMGKDEEVEKTRDIIVNIAEYLLNPKSSLLENLNESLSKLPNYGEEKEPSIPILERYPKLRHIITEFIFIMGGVSSYFVGVTVLNISTDSAYIAAVALFGTLTAGYMGILKLGKTKD